MEKAKTFTGHFSDGSKKTLDTHRAKTTESKQGEIRLKGEMELPLDFCNRLHQLQINQQRISAKLDLLFGILRQMGVTEGNGRISKEMEEDLSRIHWGKSEEEQKLTLFQILKEVEDRGIALRTTELKELGGKFSTAVSYSYKIFGGWKEALKSYKDYRSMDGEGGMNKGF